MRILGACYLLFTILASGGWGESRSLTVLAAASLTDAFQELGKRFEEQHPGVRVVLSFGGSQQLATQIVHGVPADVFASADEPQMQAAVRSGRIDRRDVQVFAQNSLVLAVAKQAKGRIKGLEDLEKPGVRVLMGAPEVPVGRYALGVLRQAGLESKVVPHVVSYEPNVRLIVAKLALGEADAGLVYRSDLYAGQGRLLTAVAVLERFQPVISYPMAILKDAPERAWASAFCEMVRSPAGQGILMRYGLKRAS